MTPEGMGELAAALRAPAEHAYVLTGTASAFCLGADLKWLGRLTDPAEGVATLVAAHHEAVLAMRDARVPVISAVNGAAAGGGISLALAADYCVASVSATFTAAYFRLGLTPDGGNSLFLGTRGMELLLTNRTLTAADALGLGLVAEVAEDVLGRACELAAGFVAVPGETLVQTRRLLAPDLEERLRLEEAAVVAAARRPAFQDALREFLARSSR